MVSTMASFDAVFQGVTDPGKIGLEALNGVGGGGAQKLLAKSVNAILPVMLLLGGFGTIVYRWTSFEGQGSDVVQTFLVMVLLQLLPMAALKLKTWVCSDLVSLVPAALSKTLMMHVAVLSFRMGFYFYAYLSGSAMYTNNIQMWAASLDCISLFVSLYLLFKEFGFELKSLLSQEHSDVLMTIAGGCLMATIVNIIAPPSIYYCCGPWHKFFSDLGNYLEVLAFVPCVRIVCLEIGVEEHAPGTNVSESDRRKTQVFMAFILAFYFWEDICFAVGMAEMPLVAAAKAAHYMMLMDFAGYFVLQARAQPEIVDRILPKVLPEAILQEVMPKQDPELGVQMDEEKKGLLGEEDDVF